jgi:hypothetical protein
MHQAPPNMGMWTYLIPLIVAAMVILRNSRARRLRVETLWIAPLMILLLVGLSLSQEGMPTPGRMAIDLAALGVGACLGWWRARFTNITVNPETHELTSQASPIGMLVVLGIFAVRYGVRLFAGGNAGANIVADASLVMSVGLVCAQRLEIALRASRLLAEARSGSAA